MKEYDELAVKVTKEIVVKFIEMGGLSIGSFEESWKKIHKVVKASFEESSAEGD